MSFNMPRASVSLPYSEINQELSEPIAPTKNILFPIKYQSPLTKIASTLEFRLPESFDAKAEKEILFTPKDDGDYFLRYNSFRRGTNDKVDFAQKYLFKNTTSDAEENLEILSELSEESEHDASYEECDSQYHGETT